MNAETPLAPYRVLDLTHEQGLLAGMLLADLGADVIQVEPVGGSPARRIDPFAGDEPGRERSLYWWSYARNKRGITLNLEHPAGRDLFLRLAERADVVIESFTPGYLDGLGLGYAALAQVNPALILTSVTPFGQTGPKAAWPATDLTVMSASGTQRCAGDVDRAPLRVTIPQSYLHAGAEAAVGTLLALQERKRSGLGQQVDVSAQQAAASCTQSFILADAWHDAFLVRGAGGVKRGPIQLRYTYPAKDGYVSITFDFGNAIGPATRRLLEWVYEEGMCDRDLVEKDWVGYANLLMEGREPFSELERTYEATARFTATKTKDELFQEARRRGILLAPIATVEDVRRSPQFAARDFWTAASPGGDVAYPGPFARFSASPIQYRRRAPLLGEHNQEVYGTELGLSRRELSLLMAQGVI